jgi:hemolysin activation/secretion protein
VALGAVLALALPAAALAEPSALVPERRRDYENRRANEYLIIPAVASLPGTGVFIGVIASASNLGGTGIDAAAAVARSIDNTDIELQAAALQGIPLGQRVLTLDYQRAHIRMGNGSMFLPGRNSPNYTIPVTAEGEFQLVRPVLRLWERRITVSYMLAFFEGFSLDANGNEASVGSHSAAADASLDFTDDVTSPTRGFRFRYRTTVDAPEESPLGRDTKGPPGTFFRSRGARLETYQTSGYIPLTERFNLALAAQYSQSSDGGGGGFRGGGPPLRGYPGGRWSDVYGVFAGAELRYTVPVNYELDAYIARGLVEGIQYAVFYELGQVNPDNGPKLFDDVHRSYGAGVRALFQSIVLRFDLGFSDEGVQTHLTIDQAF